MGHLFGDRQGVGPRLLIDGDQGGLLAVILGAQRIVLGTQFGMADVLETHQRRPLATGPQDDVVEFLRGGQAALGGNRKGLFHRPAYGGLADAAHGILLILPVYCLGDIAGGDAELRHTVRFDP